MDEERLLSYHRFTREHGVNRPLYFLARLILVPSFLLYFRLSRIGREHGKVKGPLIVAANHRSFLDPFVIGSLVRRPVYYMAKRELFDEPVLGTAMRALGMIPIDREDPAQSIALLNRARDKYDLTPLVIHDNYLINLAAADETILLKSIASFREEVERADQGD